MKGGVRVHSRISSYRWERGDLTFPHSQTATRALWAHRLHFWWLPLVLRIFDLSSLQVPGPPHLSLTSTAWTNWRQPQAPVVGLPGKQPGNGVWLESEVGKFPSVS